MGDKLYAKWEEEKKSLESVRRQLKKYQKQKNEKAEKEELIKTGDKIAAAFEDNKWMKLEWKDIKRSKAAIETGLEEIDKKIATRSKKMENDKEQEAEAAGDAAESEPVSDIVTKNREEKPDGKDWSGEIAECGPESVYYHWAYGKMEVVYREEDYIYMRLADKKGCRHEWLDKNNQVIEIDGKQEEVKEFSVYSIGKWLYPSMDEVDVKNKETAHKTFRK